MSNQNENNGALQYGGQAVIEGVMMRSPRYFAVACRKPDGGIIVQDEPVDRSIIGKLKWLNKPFLRGSLALIDAMALGTKALNFAARVQAEGIEGEKGRRGEGESRETDTLNTRTPEHLNTRTPNHINDIAIGLTLVVSICFGIALFVALPTFMTQLVQRGAGFAAGDTPYSQQVLLNGVDGVIRISIFLGYIALISRMENIRRVFQYHGAEHKAINTLESGEPLTVENCLRASRIHPRCGTSFIIIVLVAGVLVHCVFPRPPYYFVRLALHIALIPLVAGFSYEIIKLAGKYRDHFLPKTLLAPGLWSQRLTTREPDATQIEVALAALNAVLALERAPAEAEVPVGAPAAVA